AAAGAELDSWLIPTESAPRLDPVSYDAVLSFGGAMHPDQFDRHPWLASELDLLAELLARGVPLLGVCLGAELLGAAAGAPASRAAQPEVGWFDVELSSEGQRDPLLGPLAPGFPAFSALEWHSYELSLPPGAVALARSAACLQAYRA